MADVRAKSVPQPPRNRTMTTTTLAIVAVLFACALFPGRSASAKVTLDIDPEVANLAGRVRIEETYFNNAEVSYTYTQRLMIPPTNDNAYTSVEAKVRQITLGKGYWIDYQSEMKTAGNQRLTQVRTAAFDGRITRIQMRNAGTMYCSRIPDPDVIHPHELFGFTPRIRLSDYLTTGLSDTKFPDGLVFHQTMTRKPNEMFGGIDCNVVEVVDTLTGTFNKRAVNESSRTILWICPERNYLPLRVQTFERVNGEEKMLSVQQINQLTKVGDRLYYPDAIYMIDFDPTPRPTIDPANPAGGAGAGADAGAGAAPQAKPPEPPKEHRRRAWTIDKVRLNPQIPYEKLRDVKFRDGTTVTIINEGNVLTKYKVGNRPSELEADRKIQTLFGLNPTTVPFNANPRPRQPRGPAASQPSDTIAPIPDRIAPQ